MKCTRLFRTTGGMVRCGGELRYWWGTDGHSGLEQFSSCKKCGATS